MRIKIKNKMHLKRHNIEKFWPIPRKGTKYISVSSHDKNNSIPLLVVMRDILKIVRNRKELKKILSEKQVLVNNRMIRDVRYPISLLDIISFPSLNKYFISTFSHNKKINIEEIDEKKSDYKIFKVINKKKLKGNKTQVNLTQGRNLILTKKVDVDDSIIFNLKKDKFDGIIKMEKGKKAYVIRGKHLGIEGVIEDIIVRGGKKLVKIKKNDNKINVWIKNVIVVEDAK